MWEKCAYFDNVSLNLLWLENLDSLKSSAALYYNQAEEDDCSFITFS